MIDNHNIWYGYSEGSFEHPRYIKGSFKHPNKRTYSHFYAQTSFEDIKLVRKQPIIALYFESVTVLKFYNLDCN